MTAEGMAAGGTASIRSAGADSAVEHGAPGSSMPAMSGTVLALVTSTALLVSFSESMLIPALPTIQEQYGASSAAVSWVPAIYLLVGAISVPLFGKLGDLYGKKRMLMIVMAAYSFAVVLDGFAWNLDSLLVFRAIQGLGLAMFPLVIALIHDQMPADRVPVSVGLVTSMNGVGAAIGLIGGAWITQEFSWQTNYHILAPFAILLTVLLGFLARESPRGRMERIDYLGITFLGLGVTMILVAISEGGVLGWTSGATLTLFLLGAVFAVLFVLAELRAKDPILEVRAPGVGNLMKVNFAMLLTGGAMFIGFYVVIYFAQEPTIGLGRDVTQAAVILAPAAILMLLFAPLGGRLAQRVGPKLIQMIGGALIVFGFVLLLLFHAGGIEMAVAAIVLLAGVSFLLTTLSITILILSAPEKVGTEIGVNTSFRTIGQAVGVAISGAFLAGYVLPGTGLPTDAAYAYTVYAGIAMGLLVVALVALLPHLKVRGTVGAVAG